MDETLKIRDELRDAFPDIEQADKIEKKTYIDHTCVILIETSSSRIQKLMYDKQSREKHIELKEKSFLSKTKISIRYLELLIKIAKILDEETVTFRMGNDFPVEFSFDDKTKVVIAPRVDS